MRAGVRFSVGSGSDSMLEFVAEEEREGTGERGETVYLRRR